MASHIFTGDFGGTMGLWLGASVLAAVQLLDYLILRCIIKCRKSGKISSQHSEDTKNGLA